VSPVVEAAPVAPAPAPVEEKKVEAPVQPTVVKTTTTLSDLEKELEESAKAPKAPSPYEHDYHHDNNNGGKNRRPHKISDEEVEHVKPDEAVAQGAMPIYTQEELAAIEKEENENGSSDGNSEDVDIDQYDKYYDDDNNK
jgi:hypothetical protein